MIIKRTPTTLIALFFSWLTALLGLIGGIYLIFSNRAGILLAGVIIIGSLILAVIIRILSNIGQILFDLNSWVNSDLAAEFRNANKKIDEIILQQQNMTTQIKSLSSRIDSLDQNIISNLQLIYKDVEMLKNSGEQINCDSKDINQNIHQIKTFFEQIERHLDLKK